MTRFFLSAVLLFICAADAAATDYTPTTGELLQTAFTNAVAGDTITLDPSITYSRTSMSSGYSITSCPASEIHVRSSAYASITTPTAAMTRAEWDAWIATNTNRFAKIITGDGPTFDVRGGVCNWRFTGLEITSNGTANLYTADLISVCVNGSGAGGTATRAEKAACHDITFEKSFIHSAEITKAALTATSPYRTSGRCMAFAGNDIVLQYNYCAGMAGFYSDQALVTYTTVTTAPSPGASGTSMTVANAATLSGGNNSFFAIVWPTAVTPTLQNYEVIRVTNVSGNVLTFERQYILGGPGGGRTVVNGDQVARVTTIDSYGFYACQQTDNISIYRNYINAHVNPIFTGGCTGTTAFTSTLVSSSGPTNAVMTSTTGLAIGMYMAFDVPTWVNGAGNSLSWRVAEVTNIAGTTLTLNPLVGTPSGLGSVTPNVPGAARWDGDRNLNWTINENTLEKRDEPGGLKGWIELKDADTFLIDRNRMLATVNQAPDIAMTIRNQDGGSPWQTIKHVTITNNYLNCYGRAVMIQLYDDELTTTQGYDVTFHNNLGIGCNEQGLNRHHESIGTNKGLGDVVMTHNTLIELGPISATTWALQGISATTETNGINILRDNLLFSGNYGISCYDTPGTHAQCWGANRIFSSNVIVDTSADQSVAELDAQTPGNLIAASIAAVGFVDYNGGNYGLAEISPYKNAASDVGDIGVNCSLLPPPTETYCNPEGEPPPPPSDSPRRSRNRGRFR